MSRLKTIEECKLNIQNFANAHKLIFEDKGECGFGRECVGLMHNNNFVDYNPTDISNGDYIDGFFDERFDSITPADAYHKHNCIAVLGRGEDAIRQLSDWVDRLNEIGVIVDEYPTGATGFQATISGVFGKAVRACPLK